FFADAERAVRTEPTRNARDILNEMVSAVNDKTPVLSAQQKLDLYRELLPAVQLEEINRSFKENFAPGNFAYVVTSTQKEGVPVPARSEVLATAKKAWAEKLETRKEEAAPSALMENLPTPGKIVESSEDPDLKITSAWLSNGD